MKMKLIVVDTADLFTIDLVLFVLYLVVKCEEAAVSNKRLPGKLIHLSFNIFDLINVSNLSISK